MAIRSTFALFVRAALALAGASLGFVLLSQSAGAAARRSRTEHKPLYTQPLLQAAPGTDLPQQELEELITPAELEALAPHGLELLLLRDEPSRFAPGAQLVLSPRRGALVLALGLSGNGSIEQSELQQLNPEAPQGSGESWGDPLTSLWQPQYECTLSLRSVDRVGRAHMLEAFDSAANAAYLETLASTPDGSELPLETHELLTGLGVAGGDALCSGREYLAWGCVAMPPLDDAAQAAFTPDCSGTLQALLHSGGRWHLLSLHFSACDFDDAPALTRNIAACIAERMGLHSGPGWTYSGGPELRELTPEAARLAQQITARAQAVAQPARPQELAGTAMPRVW